MTQPEMQETQRPIFRVQCYECGAALELDYAIETTPEDWNTRADAPNLARIEALEKALDEALEAFGGSEDASCDCDLCKIIRRGRAALQSQVKP